MACSRFKLSLLVIAAVTAITPVLLAEAGVNWAGNFTPCFAHAELCKRTSMSIGVRLAAGNPTVNREFRRAMDFWAKVLDMSWHQDQTTACALQVVDGTPEILEHSVVARSQFTDWDNFQGWIAFDSKAPLTRTETFVTAVHEIGHTLGLQHNPSARSVMYYIDLEGPEVLDESDLASLEQRHRLRHPGLAPPIRVNDTLLD
jgi:hypothetical protein